MKMITERILAGLQYLLPHHMLSRLVYRVMRIETRWIKNGQISLISSMAGIDAEEALSPDPEDYPCFNAWFTRALKPGARAFDPDPQAVLMPSDGKISQSGFLQDGRLFQAKGKWYSLRELLADDPACDRLNDGYFATIYLSPRDYHRVHMPVSGRLERMIHVPGRLFSVAPYTVRQVPRLFARNERVISVFETDRGPVAMVMVGAMLVSSTQTVWAGEVTPTKNRGVRVTEYGGQDIRLSRGEEMGRFNMGSTVILVMPRDAVADEPPHQPGEAVLVGQRLATLAGD